jgi:hypothetical protein
MAVVPAALITGMQFHFGGLYSFRGRVLTGGAGRLAIVTTGKNE